MTIYSIVHEGDSMEVFFWKAFGLDQPAGGGNGLNTYHRFPIDLGGGNGAIVASYARGGSRIQTNSADLNTRVAVLNALITGDYPGTIGPRMGPNPDTRQDRHWILSLQIGTNPDSSNPVTQLGFLEAYIATLHPAWNVVLANIPSRTDGIIANFDTSYAQPYNALISAPGWAAAHGVATIANTASVSELGSTAAADNPTYFVDKVHCTDAGWLLGAPVVRGAIDAVIADL